MKSARAVLWILIAELVLNAGIALAKIIYGTQANAIAIEADGFHSLSDGLNNIVAIVDEISLGEDEC